MLYERTAISKKPEAIVEIEIAKLREQDQISADLVFRDPYLLDFLGLQGAYSERDLELAILADMERFLLEMGDGFCFVARQKRLTIGADDFYIDLLFFEVLQLDGSSIRVAEYLTELPQREALRSRLHHAIAVARERAAAPSLSLPASTAARPTTVPKPRRKKKQDSV